MLVPDPRGMSFNLWAATVIVDLGIVLNPEIAKPSTAIEDIDDPSSDVHWKRWAQMVYEITTTSPNPQPYANWQDWALAWVRTT
jgi:hypothetical protein